MMASVDGNGKRIALIGVVVLAIANVFFWGVVYNRQSVKPSSFTARLTPTTAPSVAPIERPQPTVSAHPSASATPSIPAGLPVPLPLPNASGRALKVSIVGDLLGTGHYASSPSTRYRGLLLAALQARGAVSVEEATGTGGTLSAAVQVPPGLDLAVVELGTNDMASTDVNGFEQVYSALLKSIRLGSPDAALVCAGTWSADGLAFDNIIQQDCVREQGHFVSLRDLYDQSANRGPAGIAGYYGVSDDVAPNDTGHRAIAQALLQPLGITLGG
jgi:acyl-CoA thioesterase I